MKLAAAILLCGLACCIAVLNGSGWYLAARRQRRDESGGYSHAPLLSILFSAGSYYLGRDVLGLWPWLPALLDPGTWLTAIAPFWIPWIMYQDRKRRLAEPAFPARAKREAERD